MVSDEPECSLTYANSLTLFYFQTVQHYAGVEKSHTTIFCHILIAYSHNADHMKVMIVQVYDDDGDNDTGNSDDHDAGNNNASK